MTQQMLSQAPRRIARWTPTSTLYSARALRDFGANSLDDRPHDLAGKLEG